MKGIIKYVVFMLLLSFSSCGDNFDYEYSNYHPYFTFNNRTHNDAILATAMNAFSPGVFCVIKSSETSGKYCFEFSNNQGLRSSAPVWFDSIDMRLESWKHVGMNNGLIVGYGNLDNPAVFFAYDLQCPNCFDMHDLPLRSYELTISNTGVATCNHCHRKYNLNTGGNIVSGASGKKLTRYRANSTGPFGVLGVS